tara:strand:+ start:250 stop:966 length:717 start_codon:yes stop_codon:yes gene_type:complete
VKIAIIASGIIKCYSTLEYLSKLNFEGATFKVFGQCYDFMGNLKENKEKIKYESGDKIDLNKVSPHYTDINIISGLDFINKQYDSEGYSTGHITQWENVKQGLMFAEKYEDKTKSKFDVIIRTRPDIILNSDVFLRICKQSIFNKKIYLQKKKNSDHHWDHVIVGESEKMKKVLRLYDDYYNYLNLEKFKKMEKGVGFNGRVRFGCESEIILQHHIENLFGKNIIESVSTNMFRFPSS